MVRKLIPTKVELEKFRVGEVGPLIDIVSYFFNVDFLWQDMGAREDGLQLVGAGGDGLYIF